MLMGIFFIIFMGVFIKCCAVHTPSSNPKKPPARRFSETLRRPINTLRRMVIKFISLSLNFLLRIIEIIEYIGHKNDIFQWLPMAKYLFIYEVCLERK